MTQASLLDRRAPHSTPTPRGRPVDQRLALCLRLLLEARHEGLEQTATWETLRAELEAEGLRVNHVRRLQEAAAYLRRVEKVAVGGVSGLGICIVKSERDRRLVAGERVKRIRAEVEELAAFDRALYEQIADALPAVGERGAA